MTPAKEPVAFLGIGTMGHVMAASALRAGIETIVWNRDPEATRDLTDVGVQAANSTSQRRATSRHRRHDGDGCGRGLVDRQGAGDARSTRPRRHLGADEHDRRRRGSTESSLWLKLNVLT